MRNRVLLSVFAIFLILVLVGCGVVPPLNQSPNASFTTSPTSGVAPLEVSFDASGSYDPDGNILSYEWDFKDGNTGSGEIVNHTFSSIGNYDVRLTVTDDKGATDSTTKTITVMETPNQSPIASFTVTPASGVAPLEVSFNASNSSDSDGSIISYDWDFGDGSNDSGITTIHTYENSGDYTVQLTIIDNDGAIDSTTKTITINNPEPQLYATIINLIDSKGNDTSNGWPSPSPVLTVGETVTITVNVDNDVADPVFYEFVGTGFPNVWQTENYVTVTIDNDVFNLDTIHLRVFVKNSDDQYTSPYYDDMVQVYYQKENPEPSRDVVITLDNWEQEYYEYLEKWSMVHAYYTIENNSNEVVYDYKIYFTVNCIDGNIYYDSWYENYTLSPGQSHSDYALIDTFDKQASSVKINELAINVYH